MIVAEERRLSRLPLPSVIVARFDFPAKVIFPPSAGNPVVDEFVETDKNPAFPCCVIVNELEELTEEYVPVPEAETTALLLFLPVFVVADIVSDFVPVPLPGVTVILL